MITSSIIELFQGLEQGARAITSTRRLARQVEQRYAQWRVDAGAAAWPAPFIRAYDDWLREVWWHGFEHLPDAPRLLSDDQELLLWEQVIRRRVATANSEALLQLSGTARAARRAWRRIHEWRVDWQRLRGYRSADTDAFLGWAGDFQRILRDENWLTPARLPHYLVEHGEVWLHDQNQPLWWVGFDILSPAREQVLELLRRHGLPQNLYRNAGVDNADVAVVETGSIEDEWRCIASWARSELSANPRAALGIVCPDLHNRRDDIEEVLEDVLHPELSWRTDTPRAFHLSLGRPLAEYPVAKTALDLLQWTGRRIPFDVISRSLRSPYLGGDADLHARVNFEVRLRKPQQEFFTLDRLRTLALELPELQWFGRRLEAVRDLQLPAHADPGTWAAMFSGWLMAFGWPGERVPDSHEYQVLSAWREQLSRFAGLNTVQNRWSLTEALKKLSSMAAARVLQFHDDHAPLQIMGASESAGMWFDKLWLAGMGDSVWPPPAQPDPFIPVSVQKAYAMPDASAQAVLEHTRTRTANLLASARQVRVSFAAGNPEAPESLSPLFAGLRTTHVDETGVYPGRIEQLLQSGPRLETIVDDRAPPLSGGRWRGGTTLVADQARCPFRALAHHRLHARDLREVAPGLDAMERGVLVHDAASRLWNRLQTQDNLNAMDETAVRTLVSECVAGALEREFADSVFQQCFLDIERERLEQLLLEWLTLEKRRQQFRVVGTEIEMNLQLGGVDFRIRVDRIDELDDGRRLILDYKTGQLANVRDWADPRMEEPQLPMYALSIDEDIAALALAGIKRGECELRGVGDDPGGVPSLTPVSELGFGHMAELKSWWRSALGDLVAAYRAGDARVDPRTAQTCRMCDAMPLCRVFERGETET